MALGLIIFINERFKIIRFEPEESPKFAKGKMADNISLFDRSYENGEMPIYSCYLPENLSDEQIISHLKWLMDREPTKNV